jgi:hypothetical protein
MITQPTCAPLSSKQQESISLVLKKFGRSQNHSFTQPRLFFSKIIFAGTFMLGFSLKFKTYNALADVGLLAGLVVYIHSG